MPYMSDATKISTDYYKEYVGCYAKRFYSSFKEDAIYKIIGFELEEYKPQYLHYYTDEDGVEQHELRERDEYQYYAMFVIEGSDEDSMWKWDVEDCVIITNEKKRRYIEDERVVHIGHPQYKGYDPYSGTIKK
jgi:hypothetical protein